MLHQTLAINYASIAMQQTYTVNQATLVSSIPPHKILLVAVALPFTVL